MMAASVETGCLETRTVAAFVGGRLEGSRVGEVARHIQACARCAEHVVAAVSASGETARLSALDSVGDEPPLADGSQLGRYEVRRWIGRGGMGHVYEGFDPELERKVALKVLRSRGTLDADQRAQKRLAREAKTMARLSHPNVVTVHDVGIFAGRVFLVMELVDGPTLADWLTARPRTWRDILAAFVAAGDGLAAAHDVGIVHRDFKPQNVLVGNDGKVRVTDFGLARVEALGILSGAGLAGNGAGDALEAVTRTVGLLGTPRYMSPEQRQSAPAEPSLPT